MRARVAASMPVRVLWPTVSTKLGLEGTRVRSVRSTPLGREVILSLRPPATVQRLQQASEALAVAFAAARVRVVPFELRADRVALFVDYRIGLPAIELPSSVDPLGIPRDPRRPFAIGVDDDGHTVEAAFFGRHVLIGGSPGSGKSNALRVFLASLAASRNVRVYGVDPKHAELAMWAGRMNGLVLGNEAGPTIALLQGLLDEVQRRAAMLAQTGRSHVEISHSSPWIVLVVDEWAELAAEGDAKERAQAATLLRRFVALGRAVGCTAILCTQRPTSDTVDTGTRALLSDRFALRCGDRHQAEAILGLGTFHPTDLGRSAPGRALWSDGGPARAFSFYEVPDERIPDLVCAGYRDL